MCSFPVAGKLFCDYNDIMLPLTGCYKSKSLRKGRAHEVQYSLSAVLSTNSYTYACTKTKE